MKLYQAVAQGLADAGVVRLFGLMGDANMQYVAAFLDLGAGTFISAVHESGAVSMADGYSRMSRRVGVVSVTHGPGVTNALTSLTEAVRAHSTIVLVVGDTPRQREHLQWLDLRAAAQLTGAAYREVHSPETAIDEIALALRFAQVARCPVVLNIPVSLMLSEVGYTRSQFDSTSPRTDVAPWPNDAQLDKALGIVASAERPVILAGRGAVLSDSGSDIIALAEALHGPVATTLMAKDYFRGHPLDLGIFGTMSHTLAIDVITEADCIVAIGAGLNRFTTVEGDLVRDKALVHCDDDPRVLGARQPPHASVVADARAFAQAMASGIVALGSRPETEWSARVKDRISAYKARAEFRDRSTENSLDMRAAMVALDEVLPTDRIVVTDIGRFHPAPWRFLHCSPGEFTHTSSFGSIGLGLATSVGVAIGRPDRLTVAVVGDGGGMMGMLELMTAVRYSPNLVVIVLNNGAYGSEYTKLARFGLNPAYSLLEWPSFAQLATALGADGISVRTLAEIRGLVDVVREVKRPLLIEVIADPEADPGDFGK